MREGGSSVDLVGVEHFGSLTSIKEDPARSGLDLAPGG